jgi:hypothetical protein
VIQSLTESVVLANSNALKAFDFVFSINFQVIQFDVLVLKSVPEAQKSDLSSSRTSFSDVVKRKFSHEIEIITAVAFVAITELIEMKSWFLFVSYFIKLCTVRELIRTNRCWIFHSR